MIKKPLFALALGLMPGLGWAQSEACSTQASAPHVSECDSSAKASVAAAQAELKGVQAELDSILADLTSGEQQLARLQAAKSLANPLASSGDLSKACSGSSPLAKVAAASAKAQDCPMSGETAKVADSDCADSKTDRVASAKTVAQSAAPSQCSSTTGSTPVALKDESCAEQVVAGAKAQDCPMSGETAKVADSDCADSKTDRVASAKTVAQSAAPSQCSSTTGSALVALKDESCAKRVAALAKAQDCPMSGETAKVAESDCSDSKTDRVASTKTVAQSGAASHCSSATGSALVALKDESCAKPVAASAKACSEKVASSSCSATPVAEPLKVCADAPLVTPIAALDSCSSSQKQASACCAPKVATLSATPKAIAVAAELQACDVKADKADCSKAEGAKSAASKAAQSCDESSSPKAISLKPDGCCADLATTVSSAKACSSESVAQVALKLPAIQSPMALARIADIQAQIALVKAQCVSAKKRLVELQTKLNAARAAATVAQH